MKRILIYAVLWLAVVLLWHFLKLVLVQLLQYGTSRGCTHSLEFSRLFLVENIFIWSKF